MNDPPHICLYTDDPGLGGTAVNNHALLCGLVRAGYRVSCVQSRIDNPLIRGQQELGIKHHWLDYNTSEYFPRTAQNVADGRIALEAVKPDLILFSNSTPCSHIAAKTGAIESQIPYFILENFVRPYDSVTPEMAWMLKHVGEQYVRARAVVAVSQQNLEMLHRLYRLPAAKGEIIYYGRPDHFFEPPCPEVRERMRREADIPADAVVCLTTARLSSIKGYQHQLLAIAKLRERPVWRDLHFAWLGTGPLADQLKTAIANLGIGGQVHLLGQRWDVPNWLDASDIFILPSHCEGMPLSIMEAMAKGLPVIASAVSGVPEELCDTGKLLPSPVTDAAGTEHELAAAIETWAADSALRREAGAACRRRAEVLFREERMMRQVIDVVERCLLPPHDYVSPGLAVVRPDCHFPNMIVGDRSRQQWSYLRRQIPHNWYVDQRSPLIGFVSRDEAHILYNTALQFQGLHGLEIGCWLGWATCHLALGGVLLDVIDPTLADPIILESVRSSLASAGVLGAVNLVAGPSPQEVERLGKQLGRKWSLFFVDGNHDAPHPLYDAATAAEFAEDDALVLFHDLASPEVAQGLDYLRRRGWNTLVYMTMQIMGVAWRGKLTPVQHRPDPDVAWSLPTHLRGYAMSGT